MVKILSGKPVRQSLYFQVFFWVALFLFVTARNYGEHENPDFREMIIYDFCHWIFQIIGANFIYYILVRKYFDNRRYVEFSVYLLLSLYGISVINRLFIIYVAEPFFVSYPQDTLLSIFTDLKYLFFHYTLPIITGAFIFISVMFMLRYRNEKQNHEKLLKEKAELELQALKSRLNPHFLFNTLNNIYSLSLLDPEKTSESISRLSDILDYILYKGQDKMAAVSDELTIVNNYIELEKLRYDERLQLNLHTQLDSPNVIPPLIYLSLVENAFKHGAGKMSGGAEIYIDIKTTPEQSVLRVENTCPPNIENNAGGIGLDNMKEQLKLYYKNNFTFSILHNQNRFIVELITPAFHD
ncbi:histidine kinase [Elizabethkingia ursingii]|uniref:sensor histidine kinase n=1 Tax=Elizabethkingia ursingii TaxID=1756150 RepID=UPI00099B16AA|nr:sensor histidine kinase [Elizabethkingia ursingii]OPC06520.1 histidine kinase [Elizabethkingia ursingii]